MPQMSANERGARAADCPWELLGCIQFPLFNHIHHRDNDALLSISIFGILHTRGLIFSKFLLV